MTYGVRTVLFWYNQTIPFAFQRAKQEQRKAEQNQSKTREKTTAKQSKAQQKKKAKRRKKQQETARIKQRNDRRTTLTWRIVLRTYVTLRVGPQFSLRMSEQISPESVFTLGW